jgi:hypothetical protein
MAARDINGTFEGWHYETGTLANALRLRGARAPHTGQPYTEALLLGVSGGVAFGYFTFEYTGLLPHVALLSRNTFDPWQTLLERLPVPHEVRQTTSAETGHKNLVAALEAGHPVVVWADRLSLGYTQLGPDPQNWHMQPLLVIGQAGETFQVVDRSRHAWTVTADELRRARARVKKERFRVVTLDPPNPERLPGAVRKGIEQCLSLFTEAPRFGKPENWGLAGLAHWAELLTNQRSKQGWERYFEPGPRLFQALAGSPVQPGAYHWIMTWGAGPGAERGVYADFLDEAAVLLAQPALRQAAERFRASAGAWTALARALLPADVPLLGEAGELIDRRKRLVVEQGPAAADEIRRIDARHRQLAACAAESFPLDAAAYAERRAGWAEQVLAIRDLEQAAVGELQSALG